MRGKFEGRKRRGWQRIDGWMTSPTWWTQVWASSRSWWWTGKTNVLQSMESQRAGRDWVTKLNIIYKTGALGRIWPKQTPSKALGCDSRKEKKESHGREGINRGCEGKVTIRTVGNSAMNPSQRGTGEPVRNASLAPFSPPNPLNQSLWWGPRNLSFNVG